MPRRSAGNNYLYGDNKAANALIKKHNPEMTDELLAYSVAAMKGFGIVDSGDNAEGRNRRDDGCPHGELLRQNGARRRGSKPSTDFRKSYTLQFVNKGVGIGFAK